PRFYFGLGCPETAERLSIAAGVAAQIGCTTIRDIGIGRPVACGLGLLHTAWRQYLLSLRRVRQRIAVVGASAGAPVEGVWVGGPIAVRHAALARRLSGDGKKQCDCKAGGDCSDPHDFHPLSSR